MSGKLWIGIDGGGTKTIAVIGNESGRLLAAAKGSSSNLTAISTEQLYTLINNLIDQLLMKTGVALSDVETIFAAMAGADRQAEQQKIYDAFLQSPVLAKLKVQSDIHAALAAGTWGREGTLLIAGTGAIIFGYEQQNTFRVGGWGYLLGDEGSGYHLGKLAIRSVLKAHDDKMPLKLFQKEILTHFNVLSPDQLITKVYSSTNPVAAISSVSRIVLDAFEEDTLAKAIVYTVQEALLELIESAYSRIDRTKPVVLHGGLFSNNIFYEEFNMRFSSRFPDLIALKPTISGTVGAYLLALHENKIEVSDPVKQMIQQTWRLLEGEIT
ncbi:MULTISPECIES: N-acetylglucosamine kinase [Solibacillus]|uniref:N-acetylglucosamine kinase n=1 Tax=Solibacillus merdavium TaxID=2762218 RepID=A0ABR8XQT5_9BACL|nr:BadF/BadG/BcrA/BcrD ATPase family protein [Solibacillus merdavium]MBD8034239.1 N-acetylglucosamine kinase [Solibacillus merdavium]